MASSKINTKFILILGVLVMFVGGAVGGIVYLRMKTDAGRHVRAGAEWMQQQNYREAFLSYARAARKEPGNVEYLAKMEEALLNIVPESTDEARDMYERRLGVLRQAVRSRSSDPERHLRLIREMVTAARLHPSPALWGQIAESAETMWDQVLPDNELRIEARLYEAMATFRRSRVLTSDEIHATLDLIEEYTAARPESDWGWATQVAGRLTLAEQVRSEGSVRRSEEELGRARAALEAGLEKVPNGPELAKVAALYWAMERYYDEEAVSDEQMRAALDHMLACMRTAEDAGLVNESAQLLQGFGAMGYHEPAIEMVSAYIEKYPDALSQRGALIELYFLSGQLDDAETAARTLVDLPQLSVSFEAQFQAAMQKQAASKVVDILFRRWELADDDARPAIIEALSAEVDELRELITDLERDPYYLGARGKLAYAKGNFRDAASRFDQLVRDQPGVMAEALLYAARSLERIGEPGRAYERMKTLNGFYPKTEAYTYECARLAYELRKFGESKAYLDQLMELNPDNELGQRLGSRLAVDLPGADPAEFDLAAAAVAEAERLLQYGQIDEARAILVQARGKDPEHLRILEALMRVELSANNLAQAEVMLDVLLERQPDNRILLRIKSIIENDDPVESIEAYYATLEDMGENDRLMAMTGGLVTLAEERERAAEAMEERGETEAAEEARAIAARASTAADGYREQVEASEPDHPQLLRLQFRQALIAQDWDRAEELVERARVNNVDLADGTMWAGQLALSRRDYEEAARVLADATRALPHSSPPWRMLAIAYERLGDYARAREAFEEAYNNNPNDLDTVRRYVTLLARTGDTTRALRVMRTAIRLAPNNLLMRESWLRLEESIGDRAVAIAKRFEIYSFTPEDKENTAALATLLATTEPTYEFIVNEKGELLYSQLEWARLTTIQQQETKAIIKKEWDGRVDTMLDQLSEENPDDLRVIRLRANLLRERGRIAEGEQVLSEYIERQPESERTVAMYLTLGQYQANIGRDEDALATFETARAYQDDTVRDAELAIGDLLFSRERYAEAEQAFTAAMGGDEDDALELRIIESLARRGALDDAANRLQARMDGGLEGYFEQMLLSTISHRRGLVAATQRDADARFAARDAALDKASELSPGRPEPHIERARALLEIYLAAVADMTEFEVSDYRAQSTLLDDALQSLESADEVSAGNLQTALVRVAVFQALDSDVKAIGELVRLLDNSPDESNARIRLVQLYNATGEFEAALRVIDQGADRNPTVATWPELKGDLCVEEFRRAEAAGSRDRRGIRENVAMACEAYATAVNLEPTPGRVVKLAIALLSGDQPRHAEAVAALRKHESFQAEAPALACLHARALHGEGRFGPARDMLRTAYQLIIDASGDEPPARTLMTEWYRSAESVLADRPVQETESLLMQLAGSRLTSLDQRWLAERWAASGTDGLSRALELQREAIAMFEGTDLERAENYFQLAQYLLAAQQFNDAVDPLLRTIELNPKHLLARNNAAYLLSEFMDKPDDALPHAVAAAELLSADSSEMLRSSVLDTVGWIQYRVGKEMEASEENLRASVKAMETASNCLHLATLLADTGRYQQAEVYLAKAAELRPNSRTADDIAELLNDIRTRQNNR